MVLDSRNKLVKSVYRMYKDMQEFKVEYLANEEDNSKKRGLLMNFINFSTYGEDSKRTKTGFLNEMGYLTEVIDKHNRSYTYLSDKNWKERKNGEKPDEKSISKKKAFEGNISPFYIEDIGKEADKNSNNVKYVTNIKEEFLKEKIARNTNVELLAKCMHWSNKSAKCIDNIRGECFSKEELKKYQRAYKKVSRFVIPKVLSDYMKLIDYDEQSDLQEIKLRVGEEEYESFVSSRKKIMAEIMKNKDLRGVDFDNLMQYALLKKTKSLSYSMKHLFTQRAMYEIAKTENSGYAQYMRKDEDKAEDDPYRYVYGISIDGYSEPFEIHICTDENDSNDFKKMIKLSEGMLKKDGVSKKIEIPFTNTNMLVKTAVPFKIKPKLRSSLDALCNCREFKFDENKKDAVDSDKMVDIITGAKMSPQAFLIKQSLESYKYMEKGVKQPDMVYSSSGIENLKEKKIGE